MSCDNRCTGDDVFPAPCATCKGRKPAMKFKANNWLDTKAHTVLYGIDVKMNGTWHHASADNQPLFFNTAEERDAKIVELRKAS